MNIAIIGADSESVHTIEKAHMLGHKVICVDQDPDADGADLADEYIKLDISHEKEVIEALRQRSVDFVCATPLGRHMITIGAVNDALRLPGIGRDAAELCTDKYLFHKRLTDKKLREGFCYLVNRKRAASVGINDFPAVFKPRFGSHGRSVHYLGDAAEYEKLLRLIWSGEGPYSQESDETSGSLGNKKISKEWESPDDKKGITAGEFMEDIKHTMEVRRREASGEDDPLEEYILEEALPGTEYAVDGVVEVCNYETILIRKKNLTPPPARQAISYVSLLPGDNQRVELQIKEYMSRLCEILSLKDCLLHADICILGRKVNCIEVSACPAGRHVYDELIPMATGVDVAEQYIRHMSGESHNFHPVFNKRMFLGYFDMEKSFVYGIPTREELVSKLPEGVRLRKWQCNIKLLDYMGVITDEASLLDRGCFILEGSCERELEEAANMILGSFELK